MKKSDLYGIISSAIFCGIILLLLFLIVMPMNGKPEEEGIIVSFGDSFDGGGDGGSGRTASTNITTPQQTLPSTPSAPQAQQPSTQDLLAQEDNSFAIAKQAEERKKREQEELERKKRQEEEKRIAEEKRLAEEQRLAEERRIAEQRQREQQAIDRANALGDVFGGSSGAGGSGSGAGGGGLSNGGSGSDTGDSQQGNPVGKGSSGGNSWSLDGRTLIGGRLIPPNYNRNVEGKITVTIRVDESGNVTNASIGTPTDISDEQTRKAALEAARKTKFSTGKNIATGTITYNFKLK